MGTLKDFARRATACALALTITFSTVPRVAARDAILGSVVVSGTAFSATAKTDWVPINGTRPLVSGDRLKTEEDATLVADFSELGIVGLYGDSEISVVEQGTDITVEARRGQVAFYIAPQSRLKLTAGNAKIVAGTGKAEGYVEFNDRGAPELVVESDEVNVVVAGGAAKVFVRGNRVVLNNTLAEAPATVATTDERKAGVIEEPKKSHRISPLGWTAIAGAVAAVGIGVGIGVSGGGGGGGGDSNGSE